ncbi:MAG: DEAD/DEAH box helicase [Pirellulaceae bacterium]|jgi:superfamily II DNA/RNA helicase|nr:DEAD/DEAH box helicase [Pirellulaceae bacterium]
MSAATPARDDLAARYFEQLPYAPYPFQEEALLTWFTAERGVLVCAPTGMGKTLIAEAALFEALHNGTIAYYTTPLIALTDQKFYEMQESAIRWGFRAEDVGLVTGNRRINPEARILVVVAEILLNRLLHAAAFDFSQVSAVVMDEFHSFNDVERGIVWELTLGLLPAHVRILLLSATVGNSLEFIQWLSHHHQRRLELVQSQERKVPLIYQWIGDMLLNEFLESMAAGDELSRKTPALVFCFNREMCWNVAEQVKGKQLIGSPQQKQLAAELDRYDWSQGAGPKLRQLLLRGVGVHHAGVLPKYKRIVEELFQRKLLAVTICTETLSAGINLPARSVVVPELLKGPPGEKKLIDPSTAHQIFGRAGRPQFDTQGFVFALAHEDDVKILRWRAKYDSIPEDTKDPQLLKAKKALKRKMPTRRTTEQYWSEAQFEQLRAAPPGRLSSRGMLPWRLLAYWLDASPEVDRIRELVGKRLVFGKRLEANQRAVDHMLRTLWTGGYVELEPPPPTAAADSAPPVGQDAAGDGGEAAEGRGYRPHFAHPTPALQKLLLLRGVNPLYGVFLANQLGIADQSERLQALESVLEMPPAVAYHLHVPGHDELPPGPLATTRLDVHLLQRGLVTPEQLGIAEPAEERAGPRAFYEEEPVYVLTLADKLRLAFDSDFPGVHDLRTRAVWCAGELLQFGGDFNKFITAKQLQKQEGVIFRHLLRLILLIKEFTQLTPPDTDAAAWRTDLDDLAMRLTDACRRVDPTSTDRALEDVETDTLET